MEPAETILGKRFLVRFTTQYNLFNPMFLWSVFTYVKNGFPLVVKNHSKIKSSRNINYNYSKKYILIRYLIIEIVIEEF